VDDCFFADIRETFLLTSAASVVALEDVFGPKHPCQPTVLSMEKLHLVHGPSRQLLGQFPDTGPMVVAMSSRRRNKILGVIDEGKWCTRQQAGIRDLGKLDGLLINATEYHPWGRCQFFLLQNLLRNAILTQYHRTRAYRDRRGLRDRIQRQLPRELWKRTDRIVSREVATFVWRNSVRIPIPEKVRRMIDTYRQFLASKAKIVMLIGHIVPRDPAILAASDASIQGVGVVIPTIKVFCLIPVSLQTAARFYLGKGNPRKLHINVFEFLGLFFAFVISLEEVLARPADFPPAPMLHTDCDNTPALSWQRKMTTASLQGQQILQLYAEFLLDSVLGVSGDHLAGELNVEPDLVSRPSELYSPKLADPLSVPFSTHITQICRKLPALASWRVFLPSREILSAVSLALSSDLSWERPSAPKQRGQFVTAASISSGSPTSSDSWAHCFL
jgi:hypothetical protein